MFKMPLKSFARAVSATLVLLAGLASPAQAQLVRLHTTQGPIDMQMLADAPITVANFMAYVRGGDFAGSIVHRSAFNGTVPFVIQGGGYTWPDAGCCLTVPSRGTIVNEFSATRSNIRGTVAMAKTGGDPNSATSQWFVNMSDNSANLNNQNGGFTVFARVTTPGMANADRVAALPRVNLQNVFPELPVANWTSGQPVTRDNAVRVTEATELVAANSSDRIFNYLEAAYPTFLSPSKFTAAAVVNGYTVRYYAVSNAYLATKDGQVVYLAPALSPNIIVLGTMDFWLATAQGAGY